MKIIFQKEQPENNQWLYKYLTIEKLIDFLLNKRIPLTRLDIFEDKLEGINTAHALINIGGDKISKDIAEFAGGTLKYITLNTFPSKRNSFRRQRELFQKTNFASCWHASIHESIAMWQLYSNSNSVAIRIPYPILKYELENSRFQINHNRVKSLKVGSMNYHKLNDLDDISVAISKEEIVGFLKDSSFQHENEFRIILEIENLNSKKLQRKDGFSDEQVDRFNSDRDKKVVYLTFDQFSILNFEIVFHPKSSKWHRANIIKLIKLAELKCNCVESILTHNFG